VINVGPVTSGATLMYSGKGRTSYSIRWWTWSKYSHIGGLVRLTSKQWKMAAEEGILEHLSLVDKHIERTARWLGSGKWLVFESTSLNRDPCCLAGWKIKGVQAHPINTVVCTYPGKLDVVPISRHNWLTEEDSDRLAMSCLSGLGKPYDTSGAAVAGTFFLKRWLFPTNEIQYCAEYWKQRLAVVDLMDRTSVVGTTPASAYRRLRRSGVGLKPIRLFENQGHAAFRWQGKVWNFNERQT